MIFLSSGVARQHRKARDDLIALLLYEFLNLRYYKHNISDVLDINDNFKFWTSFHSPIPLRKMKFSSAMLSLVVRIKSSLNCFPSLELRDITHAQYTYTHLFTGRISKLGLYSLQSYGCVRITSWITLVYSKRTCMLTNNIKIYLAIAHQTKKIQKNTGNSSKCVCLKIGIHTHIRF